MPYSTELTEKRGLKVTITDIDAKNLIEVDSAETTSVTVPDDIEDQTVFAVDTSSDAVTMTFEDVSVGTTVEVVNVGGANQISLTGGDGVTVNAGTGSGTNVPATDGAVAEALHTTGGNVYITGDLAA